MKYMILTIALVFGLSGCSAHNPNGSYDRANAASEKAHEKLNRE